MSKISLSPDASGTGVFTIASPNSNTNRTLTLPDDTGTIVTNSGNQAGSFTTLNTSGQVVFNDAGADVDFRVEGDTDANLLFVDAGSNEVGIGTASPAGKFHVTTGGTYENLIWKSEAANTSILRLSLDGDGPAIYQSAATSEFGLFTQFASGFITFGTAGSERMRIDSSGNVGIGTTTAPGGNGKGVAIYQSDYPRLSFRNSSTGDGSSDGVQMYMVSNDYYQFNNESGAQIFGTAGTERARITSGGYFKASNSGTYTDASAAYHEFNGTNAGATIVIRNTASSSTRVMFVRTPNAALSGTDEYLFIGGATTDRIYIFNNGDVKNTNNSYGAISDIKLKQDIVDAGSQWNDIKGLRIRKYHFKDDANGPLQLGVIAQEVEEVSPGLVNESPDYEEVTRTREVEKTRVVTEAVLDEDGNELEPAVTETYTEEEEYTERVALDTTTKSVKYSVLYMKAVKALQEAMERIETLEASNTALEARIAALEGQ